jgi:hypothetical protein
MEHLASYQDQIANEILVRSVLDASEELLK